MWIQDVGQVEVRGQTHVDVQMFRIAGHLHLQQVNCGNVLCDGILDPLNGSPIVEHTVKDNEVALRHDLNHAQKHDCRHQAYF